MHHASTRLALTIRIDTSDRTFCQGKDYAGRVHILRHFYCQRNHKHPEHFAEHNAERPYQHLTPNLCYAQIMNTLSHRHPSATASLLYGCGTSHPTHTISIPPVRRKTAKLREDYSPEKYFRRRKQITQTSLCVPGDFAFLPSFSAALILCASALCFSCRSCRRNSSRVLAALRGKSSGNCRKNFFCCRRHSRRKRKS